MIPSTPTALSLERAQIERTKAETEKMQAEAAKILQETRWYPVVAIGAMLVGFLGGLAGILTIAVKALH